MLVFSLAVLLLVGVSDARSAKRGHGRTKRQAEQSLGPEGIIESQNYPGKYPLSTTQTFNIAMPEPNGYYNVMFHFDALDIEYQSQCSWDFLRIEGIDKICGKPAKKDYVATEVQGSLEVVFFSDYMETKAGFHANYSSVKLDDGCTDHPCNNGTCNTEGRHGYTCDCYYGYNGTNCEHYNRCLDLPCKNGGTCKDMGYGQYNCECSYGYYGNDCGVYNKCVESPCMNNGTCEDMGMGQYNCACQHGYYGNICEDYNKCMESPCINGGSCEDMGSGQYYCKCPNGYYGNNCQDYMTYDTTTMMPYHSSSSDYNKCMESPCINGGSCEDMGAGQYYCKCPNGYYGNNCQDYMMYATTTMMPYHSSSSGGSPMSLSKIYDLLELARSKSNSSKNKMKTVQETLQGLNELLL